MSKLTYLQIVQRVADAIDSDNVTTVDESPEAEQIAALVQTVYADLITEFPWYHKRVSVNLEMTAVPHQLKLPNDVEQLMSDIIYYNRKPVYYWSPEKMRTYLMGQDTTLANIDDTGARNDKDPSYWTTFDDENITFDSYDGSLAPSLSDVWVAKSPTPPQEDDDVPDLPHNLHSVLLFGVLEEAFRTLKGDEQAATKYQQKYIKGKARAKRWAKRTNIKDDPGKKIDYGRKFSAYSRNEVNSAWINEG
jgi:hypothetical protein